MQTFELRVSAVADIVEIWHVKAATADAARDVFNGGEGADNVEFIANVDMNDERDRAILSCDLVTEPEAAPEPGPLPGPDMRNDALADLLDDFDSLSLPMKAAVMSEAAQRIRERGDEE